MLCIFAPSAIHLINVGLVPPLEQYSLLNGTNTVYLMAELLTTQSWGKDLILFYHQIVAKRSKTGNRRLGIESTFRIRMQLSKKEMSTY